VIAGLGPGLLAPGFMSNGPVHVALAAGTLVALLSGVVGVLTVIRGQSFAGHAIGDMDTLGGSASVLVGGNPLVGFAVVGVVVAGLIELLGVQRARSRDVVTGVVLGAALGLSALVLYLDATRRSTTGAAVTVLFGSLFTVSDATLTLLVPLSLAGVAAVLLIYRPLLLTSVSPDLAAARGVAVRPIGVAFLLLMGLSVSVASLAVGTILSTALLIGPAATALRLTRRPGPAMLLAGALGVVATWLGVVLAYDSYDWPPAGHGWPVSFFVVALIFVGYVVADLTAGRRARRPARTPAA
jgi:zinc/manganese transport system permease protein